MGVLHAAWRVLIYLPPLWVLVLQSLLFWQIQPAFGHSDAIVNCKGNIKYEQAVKVGKDELFRDTGLYAEQYDTNGDGQRDVIALSQTDLSDKYHRVNPLFWIVDIDFDGTPDAIYIDKFGQGKCKDIVLYEDLTAPETGSAGKMDAAPLDQGRKL